MSVPSTSHVRATTPPALSVAERPEIPTCGACPSVAEANTAYVLEDLEPMLPSLDQASDTVSAST